jgi:alkylation response protein AidB-like acyl-CoA dehydrogenase
MDLHVHLPPAAQPPAVLLAPPAPEANDEIADALVKSVHDYARDTIDAAKIDAEKHIPPQVLRGLAELGMYGITLPDTHGGSSLPATTACRAITALAEHDRSVATTVGLHLGLGTRGLVAFGTAAAKDRFLPGLASGELLAAFATTESGAGSDLSAIASKGVLQGDVLTINGQKIYVTNGGLCQVLTATIATPGLNGAQRGTSVVILDVKSPGVQVLGEEHKLGLRGSSTTTVMLDDVKVPLEQLLGTAGNGSEHLSHILSWGRLLLSAGCVGTARTALAKTAKHVNERRQFGRTLAAQEVVQRQLTFMATRVFAMRAIVEAAARSEADYETLLRLTSSSKVICSEGAGLVCDLALQLHGGCGYIEETGIAILGRDARVTRIFEGANDVLYTHLGLMELARPVTQAWVSKVPATVSDFRAALLVKHGGLKIMGKKGEQHRLGIACAWRDTAEAAQQLASRTRAPLDLELAALVERFAAAQVQSLIEDTSSACPAVLTSLAEGVLP